jgi:electron transport complex protein RnfC
LPIENAAVPSTAIIPLLQHQGPPAHCVVRPGDHVREGMLIGKADGPLSANVHSSIPGTVREVRPIELPGGRSADAVVIELGGEFDRSGRPRVTRAWDALSRLDVLGRIQAAGIVGLGGGLVPTHLKLATAPGAGVEFCVANGVDCEPSLSADNALMREKPAEIAEGLRICGKLLGARRLVLAVGGAEEDLPGLFEGIFREKGMTCDVVVLPSRYPYGHEQLVMAAVDGAPPGSAGPEGRRGKVLNVATLLAIYDAVVLDKPLIERVLTVTGGAVAVPRNLKVRLGTPAGDLFEECGGLARPPARVVIGGPMRGSAVLSLDTPVTKGTSGIVAFSRSEVRPSAPHPCIRCGLCVEACPWGLVPMRLHKLIRQGRADLAAAEGLGRCTECGCCAFACPSNIPLVTELRAGKESAGRESHG